MPTRAQTRGTSVFRASVRGAGRSAAAFTRAKREVQDEIIRELRTYGREAQVIFREAAPSDTGQLQSRIVAVPFFGRAIRPRISLKVRPDLTGHQGDRQDTFDYLDVTRRGHRRRIIKPKQARALRVHYAGHRNAAIYEYRTAVPGARPSRDWVDTAATRAERLAATAERRLARRLDTRILR